MFTIAAASARFSATSSRLPSGDTPMSRGQERGSVSVGGNDWGGSVPSGGGSSITPSRVALPVRPE